MSKQFDIVFLDMDNVLCDFTKAAVLANEKAYDRKAVTNWNIWESWGGTEVKFWAAIRNEGWQFWSNLEPYPWLAEIFSIARDLAGEVKIVTAPQKSADCYSGKFYWWQKYCPADFELMPFKSKHLLASPRRLLIDDADANVEAWRAAGGKAILFPQPWNKAAEAMDRPMYEVGRRVAELTGGMNKLTAAKSLQDSIRDTPLPLPRGFTRWQNGCAVADPQAGTITPFPLPTPKPMDALIGAGGGDGE